MSLLIPTKWDARFLALSEQVASWSKDPSTKCGAVIVRPDMTVAAMGYNGFPRGTSDRADLYEDRELKYARVVHAEVNAVLSARERLDGYTMYTWPASSVGPTCDRCASVVIQAGIGRVVHVFQEHDITSRWGEAMQRGLDMYEEAGVQVIHVNAELL